MATATQARPEATLTANDRCDQCGAQAYVRVELQAGDLLFCAHHGRRHASALVDVKATIHDESSRLDESD